MEIIKQKGMILRHAKMSDAQVLFEIEIDKDNIKNMMSYSDDIADIKKGLKEHISEYKRKKPSVE